MERITKIFAVLSVGIFIVLSGGLGHVFSAGQSLLHESSTTSSKSHCHASCLLTAEEKQRKLVFEENLDPDPLPGFDYDYRYAVTVYAASISMLLLLLLRRKPPDILAQHSFWRN